MTYGVATPTTHPAAARRSQAVVAYELDDGLSVSSRSHRDRRRRARRPTDNRLPGRVPGRPVPSVALWRRCSPRRPTTSPAGTRTSSPRRELADNGPVRGTMVIRPYGYAIWERMQAEVDDRIKAAGARERLLPAVHPRELPAAARPSTSRASAPSWPSSPTPAARSSRSRSWCGPPARRSSASTWPSGSRATATCPCCSTSGPTSCAGSCGPACSCAPPSSSGRRATPPTPPRGRRAPTPRASSTTCTRTSWSTCWPCPCSSGARRPRSGSPAPSTR